MEKIKNPEAFVGKRCNGFKFENSLLGLGYAPEMNGYIGKIGKIESYHSRSNSYLIRFPDDHWNYPADERIFDNLVND